MVSLRVRRATEDDLPAIVALLADDGIGKSREDVSAPLNPNYRSALATLTADPNQFMAVLVDDAAAGELLGCLQLTFIPGLSRRGAWRCQVESVRIAGKRRGQGLGHVLFEWVIGECHRRGCAVVQLTTDKRRSDARRFYESLGFTASHDGMKLAL
ncbi:MAG TPA: GNAT family N-acetyltransferase [Alphaproteobacteria bacterium]|nr:GNAT family N-acetyltransferase [Alphaproteobacteria bacterium]